MLPYVNEPKDDGSEYRPESPSFYKEQEKRVSWYNKALLNRESKVIFVILLFAVAAPLLLYRFVLTTTLDLPPPDGRSLGSCLIQRSARIDCGFGNVTQHECHPHCCYDLNNNRCYHRAPSRFSYVLDRNWSEDLALQPRIPTEPFSGQPLIRNLRISFDEVSSTHLSFTFYGPNTDVKTGSRSQNTSYSYAVLTPEAYIEVSAPQGIIFNTIRGPMIAANNIWEMALKLTDDTMFGLGEIPLTYDTVKVIYSNRDRPDSVPLIYAKLNDSYHGFMIDCDAPTEVSILEDNQILIRSIALDSLKFHLFVGPKPEDIMKDVMKIIGFSNKLEYWMLGTHVCSELGSDTEQAYKDLEEFLDEASRDNLFFESHCGIRPVIFNTNCDLLDKDIFENGITLIHNYNKRFIPHVSPYIQYINNTELGNGGNSSCPNFISDYEHLFIKEKNAMDPYVGIVDENDVLYPDYEFDNTTDLLKQLWPLTRNFDGVLLENNWPLDQAPKLLNETYLELPYFNQRFEIAFMYTPQWNSIRPNNEAHMYSHNKYGNNFAESVRSFAEDRVAIWSTSQWMNGNLLINRQNVNTSWASLRQELVEAALGGISGHWLWSTPICGDTEDFNADTQIGICVKWYMAATYMPLIKIHSRTTAKHPLVFSGINRMYMLKALNTRLSLSPYFYTALQTGPLLRPMFYQFPQSERLLTLTSQYSVGNDLLVVPNLLPSQSHVNVWMPPGVWYELWSGLKLDAEEGDAVTMATTQADFVTLIQGGKIIMLQKEWRETAEATRLLSNFSTIIALHCPTESVIESGETLEDGSCYAEGKLFVTDRISLLLRANGEALTVSTDGSDLTAICDPDHAISANRLNELTIYGLDGSFNNYDNLRRVTATIDFCDLQTNREIVFNFIDN